MVWEIRSDPNVRIVGEQHPYMKDISPEWQYWHWHVEPWHVPHFVPGTPMPDWVMRILASAGYQLE